MADGYEALDIKCQMIIDDYDQKQDVLSLPASRQYCMRTTWRSPQSKHA